MSRRDVQSKIHQWAMTISTATTVGRHCYNTCHQLYENMEAPLNNVSFRLCDGALLRCYSCGRDMKSTHPVYVYCCRKCGDVFQVNRNLTRDLAGWTAVVVGARTKLGHQVVLKLLHAGATVVATTRYPEKAQKLYASYEDRDTWGNRLIVYPHGLDLNTHNIQKVAGELDRWVTETFCQLDILVISAAQTIKTREQGPAVSVDGTNRYGDKANTVGENSWQFALSDLPQAEMEEVYRINAVAPCLLVQQLIPSLKKSLKSPFIINVHAREGLFQVGKSEYHIHTNMAKAGLSMLTRCLKTCKLKTNTNQPFRVHGCDPGWFSIDEYHRGQAPIPAPPIDEVDAAARVLFPVMKDLKGSYSKTRRHFTKFSY